jgi:hypothetical protein
MPSWTATGRPGSTAWRSAAMSAARPPSPARSSTRQPARPAGQGSRPRPGAVGGGLHRPVLTPTRKAPACNPPPTRRPRAPARSRRWWWPPEACRRCGGTVTLAALPIDDAWHASFGRDAVLWSPAGRLPGRRTARRPPWILTSLGALLVLIIRQVRGPARTPPVPDAARTRGAATHGDGLGHGRAPGRLGP